MAVVYVKKGEDGLPYAQIGIVFNGNRYTSEALVKTGSNLTIVSNDLLGIEIDTGSEPAHAQVGFETIPVYEADIDSFDIEGHQIETKAMIYVSDLPYFKNKSILGCDMLHGLNFGSRIGGKFYFEFPD